MGSLVPLLGHPVSYLRSSLGSINSRRYQSSKDPSTLSVDCCSTSWRFDRVESRLPCAMAITCEAEVSTAAKLDEETAGHSFASDNGSSVPRSKRTMGFPLRLRK